LKINDGLNRTNLNDVELIQREKLENKIDIKISTNNLITDNNFNTMDINTDIGGLSSDELKDRWNISLNQAQMNSEDIRYILNDDTIINDINYNNDTNDVIVNKEESNNFIENEIDELNKWREIINNNQLTPEEKRNEKAKLKRLRYKNNKKNR